MFLFILNILLDRFDFVDSVCKFWFVKYGSIDLVLYMWFKSPRDKFGSVDLVLYIESGKLDLISC